MSDVTVEGLYYEIETLKREISYQSDTIKDLEKVVEHFHSKNTELHSHLDRFYKLAEIVLHDYQYTLSMPRVEQYEHILQGAFDGEHEHNRNL